MSTGTIQACYFITALLFIFGLKQMCSPVTARRGIVWAGTGMILATVVTFFDGTLHGISNYMLMIIALSVGSYFAWKNAKKVAMTDMPQMIALYNGMGGGAAAAIAAVELISVTRASNTPATQSINQLLGADIALLAILGAMIGCIAFSGSLVAWAKLDGRLSKTAFLPHQHLANLLLVFGTALFALLTYFSSTPLPVLVFFSFALVLGAGIAMPVGGADMPVIISLFNALTGLAVGFEGYVLGNAAMIIAGIVVGSSGTLLTRLMAKAMNRSLANVFFSGFGNDNTQEEQTVEGNLKEMQIEDAAILMAYSNQVVIVPGYGMAVAHAQHKIWELIQLLESKGVRCKFAIHPVAGRMPGHMNVLLAEAGVPYDKIYDMEDINADFSNTSVALVIGANDVVNPAAKDDQASPLFGMPILDAANADNIIVVKRGRGKGFSGVENKLFFAEKTQMLFNDGQKVASDLIQAVKAI